MGKTYATKAFRVIWIGYRVRKCATPGMALFEVGEIFPIRLKPILVVIAPAAVRGASHSRFSTGITKTLSVIGRRL